VTTQEAHVLELNGLDRKETATAPADQDGYEHRRLLDPQTGEIVFWTRDGCRDGEHPVDLDEVDLWTKPTSGDSTSCEAGHMY
jgi:hypothetical protein